MEVTEQEWKLRRAPIGGITLTCIKSLRNFKLILRPLWSITEEELRGLAKILGLSDDENSINFYQHRKVLQEDELGYIGLEISNDLGFRFDCDKLEYWILAINYLRQKGFCVDNQLVEWGLVEWKEVGK